MGTELENQRDYWDGKVGDFDSIYSGQKGLVGRALDAVFRRDMYQRFDYTMESLDPVSGKTVLDIGCGTGRFAVELARRGAERVVGIDVAPGMVSVSKQRAEAAGVTDRTEFLEADAFSYSGPAPFDHAIAIGLFDYVSDALPLLRRMRELVSDRLVATFPLRFTWRAPVRRIRLALQGCPVYFYGRSEVQRLVLQAGFEKVEIKRLGKLYCLTAFAGNKTA